MAEKVSFKRADGSVVRFAAKTAKKSRGKKATRKAAAPTAAKRRTVKASKGAAKSCGCSGLGKAREHADLALVRTENLKGLVVQNVQTIRRDLAEVKGRLGKVETRVNEHEQALTSLAMRARGMFGPGAAEPPRAPSPPPRSGFGAGSPEPGRPRPTAPALPPRIASSVPNRQMTLGLN